MTTPLPPVWRRIFTKLKLDPVIVQEGKDDFASDRHKNRYPRGTIEHVSWKAGYDKADDWVYVW